MFPFAAAGAFLLACSSAPAPIVANARPPTRAFEVSLAPGRWVLTASAELANGSLSFRYCCTNHGGAQTSIAMPAGTWWIGITHTSECDKAIGAIVRAPNQEKPIAVGGVWSGKIGMVLVEVSEELANTPLTLQLFAEGGLHCCGASSVSKIEVVPL